MNELRQIPDHWAIQKGFRIVERQGWSPGLGMDIGMSFGQPMTEEEFDERVGHSVIEIIPGAQNLLVLDSEVIKHKMDDLDSNIENLKYQLRQQRDLKIACIRVLLNREEMS